MGMVRAPVIRKVTKATRYLGKGGLENMLKGGEKRSPCTLASDSMRGKGGKKPPVQKSPPARGKDTQRKSLFIPRWGGGPEAQVTLQDFNWENSGGGLLLGERADDSPRRAAASGSTTDRFLPKKKLRKLQTPEGEKKGSDGEKKCVCFGQEVRGR